jgi:hypothetical protein
MSLTVKELLQNHSRGIHSDISNNEGQYFETEIPRFNDITEAIQHKQNLLNQIDEITEVIKEDQKRDEDAKTAQDLIDAAEQKEFEEFRKINPKPKNQ